ncbi:hypothetical protein SLEP1_g43587 [Rubroshorea leprosula]|uniref:Uncharacterized protein n=1 Tax=Rubroshorea leprosula TaxID=152421 RepID=A0AAV5LEH0_9ROSI|nr:hypothetical protein SLEP1_g43587 [Rubroshorea leprosula]
MPLGRRDKATRVDVLLVVWDRLEEENQVFFQEYYQRLVLMDQINEFNRLLEKQLQLMNQMNINEGASISTVNASYMPSILEITAHNTGPASDMHQPIASSLPGIDTYGSSSWHNVSRISVPNTGPAYNMHQPLALSAVFTNGSPSSRYAPRISDYHTMSPLSRQQSMASAEPGSFTNGSAPLQTGPALNPHQPIASGLHFVSDDASSFLYNDIPTDFQTTTYASRFCDLPSMVSTQNSNDGLLSQGSGFSGSSHYMFDAVSSGELDASIPDTSSPGNGFSDSSSYMFAADSKVPQARPQNGNASDAASASPT